MPVQGFSLGADMHLIDRVLKNPAMHNIIIYYIMIYYIAVNDRTSPGTTAL